jgi:hypothetical protein
MALLVMVGLILATGWGGVATTQAGTTASPNDHTHFGQVWNGSAGYGLLVQNFAASGIGLYGNAAYAPGSTTYGVIGRSVSPNGRGVLGWSIASTGPTVGTQGISNSSTGYGVFGDSNYRGVYGLSRAGGSGSVGTYGLSIAASGNGVLGVANNGSAAYGVWGTSTTGSGVVGSTSSSTGFGVFGLSSSGGGASIGSFGQSTATNGNGVKGIANNGAAAYGVWGTSTTGSGVVGSTSSGTGFGVFGLSSNGGGLSVGTYGQSTAPGGNGVEGTANNGPSAYGVWGISSTGNGVVGSANGSAGFGVWGISANGYAGYFSGRVRVIGDFSATGAKSFVIDDPLDPANKYLYHAAVESPDMKNVYDGVVTLDAKGTAWVDLPAWFEAINKDFRYQLTSVGAPGPNLYVAQEIQGNRFKIAGGQPGAKISWQVTGIRNDPYAAQNRMQVEVNKSDQERGKYLYPQGYGQADALGMYYSEKPLRGTGLDQKLNTAGQPLTATEQKLATIGKTSMVLGQESIAAPETPSVPVR